MTIEERIAALPTDRHIQYHRCRLVAGWVWAARWRDDTGARRWVTMGPVLPAERPDCPCSHRPYRWPVPNTLPERLEAYERGRKANALRKVRSNQYRKKAELERAG